MEPTFFALVVVILLFSVIVHEVMHGLAALYFGDHTAERAGRLTLNPLPHIDPIGTILIPALLVISNSPFLIGWAKPVPVNPFNFTNLRKGELLTSSAGILANFGLAILAAILYHLFSPLDVPLLQAALRFAVSINLILGLFNLLPIPPLDGSKILISYLPAKLAAQFQSLEKYGFIILLMLLIIPVGSGSLLWTILGVFLRFFHSVLGV